MPTEPTGREHLTPVKITDTSATERAGFRKCRREWFLTTVHRLTPEQPDELSFIGNLYHKALEVYYLRRKEGDEHEDAVSAALDAFQVKFDEDLEDVKDQLGFLADVGVQTYREAGELAFEMAQNFFDREATAPLLDEIIAVEFRVRVPIRNPKTGRRTGWLSVQADVIGRKDGELTVVDHKTRGRVPNSAHLDIDDQLTAEVFSWYSFSGEFPTRAVYNVAMRRRIDAPTLIRKGKALSKDKSQGTSYAAYMQAIEENGFDRADYEDFLQYLRNRELMGEDPLFVQETTFRSPQQIEAFGRDLFQEFRDMKAVAADPARAYPNPTPDGCRRCSVRAICFTIQDDGDVEAIIKAGFTVGDPRR